MLIYFGDASLFWWCKSILVAGLYDPLLHCRWVFIAPEDQVVTLNFTRFDIEGQPENETRICPYDFIEASNLGIAMGSQLQNIKLEKKFEVSGEVALCCHLLKLIYVLLSSKSEYFSKRSFLAKVCVKKHFIWKMKSFTMFAIRCWVLMLTRSKATFYIKSICFNYNKIKNYDSEMCS